MQLSATPAGSAAAETDAGVEKADHEDRTDIIALSVTFSSSVGVDARRIIGAAPEEVLLPVVLDLNDEVPAGVISAAESVPPDFDKNFLRIFPFLD